MRKNGVSECSIFIAILIFSTLIMATTRPALAALSQEQLERFNRMKAPEPRKITYLPNAYYECTLSRMKDAQHNSVAAAILHECQRKHPAIDKPEPPKTGWFFGIKQTPAECMVKNTQNTDNRIALAHIGYACRKLYRDE